MGVTDVPQWLLPAYVQSMSHAGATASREQLRDMGTNLITVVHSRPRISQLTPPN